MAKSNLQKLQEAIAKGDLATAAILTDKIAKAAKPQKAPRGPTPRPRAKKAVEDVEPPQGPPRGRQGAISHLDESDYLAPSRPHGHDYMGGRTFTDADGVTHQYAKRVSMEGMKFVNRFDPKEFDRMPTNLEKFDKQQQKKHRRVPRPGEPGSARGPSKKVSVRCGWCHEKFMVYPWEAEKVDNESKYCCNGCVKR